MVLSRRSMHALSRAQPPPRPHPLHQILLVRPRPQRHPPPRAHPPQRPPSNRHLASPRLPNRRQPPPRPAPALPRCPLSRHLLPPPADRRHRPQRTYRNPLPPRRHHALLPRKHPALHQLRNRPHYPLGPRRTKPTQRPPRSPTTRSQIRSPRLRPPPSPQRNQRKQNPAPTLHHRLRPNPPPPVPRHHHHHSPPPRHRRQPSPPLPALPRANRCLPQTLLPHPALPASRPTHPPRRRHPLGRTRPHLRLLRPVPLRQRLPGLLRPQPHQLLHRQ